LQRFYSIMRRLLHQSYYILLLLLLFACCQQHHSAWSGKAESCYRQADMLLSSHQEDKAVLSLIASADNARKADDNALLYRAQKKLGDVLSGSGLYLQADSVYEELALLQKKNKDNRLLTATLIAQSDNMILGNVSLDKAEKLLMGILTPPSSSRLDSVTKERCYYLLTSIYRNKKQVRRAISASREGLKLSKDKQHTTCYNNLLQKCYSDLKCYDSAAYYMQRSMKESTDMISSIYIFKTADKKKQMCIVYKDFPSLSGAPARNEPSKTVQRVLNEHNRLEHAATIRAITFFLAAILLLVSAALFFYLWRRHQRRNKMIDELTLQVDDLKKSSLMIDYKNTEVYHSLLQLAQSNFEKVDSPSDIPPTLWQQLFDTISNRNPHFVEQLKVRYGIVADEDIRLCCLLHLGLSSIETARLYGCTKQAIYKRRDTIIRHSLLSSKKEFGEMIQSVPSE
jgi:tetratricopeptide (TPR) repeat protein